MGWLERFKKKGKAAQMPYLYTKKELTAYDNHIRGCYGSYSEVLHEIVSPDIHLDIVPFPPTKAAPYYKLVTMGAGAYRMNVPAELADDSLEYAEYVLYLPPNWNIRSSDSVDYWPIGMLKTIARLPVSCDTWLGYEHTIQANADASPVAENTELNSFLLLPGLDAAGNRCDFRLNEEKYMRFYQVMPLYQEELDFKMTYGTEALLERFPAEEFPPIIRPDRKNYGLCDPIK